MGRQKRLFTLVAKIRLTYPSCSVMRPALDMAGCNEGNHKIKKQVLYNGLPAEKSKRSPAICFVCLTWIR